MSDYQINNLKIPLVMLPQWSISQLPLGIAYPTSFLRSKGFLVTQRDLSAGLFRKLPEGQKYIYVDTVTLGYGCWILKAQSFLPIIKVWNNFQRRRRHSLSTNSGMREERLRKSKKECISLGIKMG